MGKKKFTIGALILAWIGASVFLSAPTLRAFSEEQFRLKFPKDVTIDGVEVGGLTREEGLKRLYDAKRALAPSLTITAGEREYVFQKEISFSSNFEQLFYEVDKGGVYASSTNWFLLGKEEKLERIIDENTLTTYDATVHFSAEGFAYTPAQTGFICDREKLYQDVENSLSSPIVEGRFPSVELKRYRKEPTVSLAQLKKYTQKIASFSTYFNGDDLPRSKNILLAARYLDGLCIHSGEEFSFNNAVGERTKKRGFFSAKVIQDGKFIQGTGGGVCQVSTTLYNGALLAGMQITRRSPHSLPVSYVAPSRDAMVSSYSDFRFKNPFPYPVYLSVKGGNGWIEVIFYGKKTEMRYQIVSKIVEEIDPPSPLVEYGEKEGILQKAKKGIKSEGYLECYQNGKLLSRERLSCDVYAPTREIIGKKIENTTD